MDQFLLNLFQEHLSKIIIGFRKEQVNANLFNGKGEIRNIDINCSIINEHLRQFTSLIEFERIHISNLSFHVSSWTNLRQAPVRIDLEHVQVTMVEPLHYHYSETDPTKRKRIRQVTMAELTQLMKDGIVPKPRQSSYNLLDRILDNLVVEIRSVHITYQPHGIFKTRRPGPWTPPALLIQLFGLRWISLDEYGFELPSGSGSSSNNNASRRQYHHPSETTTKPKSSQPPAPQRHHKKKDGTFHIDKRFETDYKISLIYSHNTDDRSSERETTIIPIVSSSSSSSNHSNHQPLLDPRKKIQVHFIIQRRIRDGEYLAVQIDMMIPLVQVELLRLQLQPPANNNNNSASSQPNALSSAQKLSALVHFLTAMTFCWGKDRAFTDPLRPVGRDGPVDEPSSTTLVSNDTGRVHDERSPVVTMEQQSSVSQLAASADVPAPPVPILDLTLTDGLSDSSSDGDDNNNNDDDENDANFKTTDRTTAQSSTLPNDDHDHDHEVGTTAETSIAPTAAEVSTTTTTAAEHTTPVTATPSQPSSSPPPGRPLLVFSNGMIVHDKFSFSVNIHEVQMLGSYEEHSHGDFRLHADGVVMELIWPLATMEMGVYMQTSVSSFSLHEQCGNRIRPLLVGGCDKNNPCGNAEETNNAGKSFPQYVDRSVRPDKFDFRQTHPHQTFGMKLTVTDDKKRPPLQRNHAASELLVFPEIGIDKLEVNVDANAWTRIARFLLNLDSERYDSRWWTGDYAKSVTSEMLIPSSTTFAIDDYLQVSDPKTRKESFFPFEDIKSTVRMANIALRVPAVTDNKIMSCDVVIRCQEMILNFSPDLPRSLVKNDASTDQISFPNDPSDHELQPQHQELPTTLLNDDDKPNKLSALGFHLTFAGFSLTLAPIIPFCPSRKPEQLLLPSRIELLLRLDAKKVRVAAEDAWAAIEAAIHVVVHEFEANLDLDLLAAGVATALSHCEVIEKFTKECSSLFCNQNSAMDEFQQRRELILEHVNQCWKNGNVSTCFSISIEMWRLSLWRQNVMRHPPMSSNITGSIELSPLLLTADLVSRDIAITLNLSKIANHRRTVLTLSAQEISFACCDFDRMLSKDVFWIEIHRATSLVHGLSYAENPMVEIFSVGLSEGFCRALEIRIEDDYDDAYSFALSAEFADGIIGSNVESLSAAVLLTVDAFFVAYPTFQTIARANERVSDKPNNRSDEMSISATRMDLNQVLELYSTLSSKTSVDVLLFRVSMKNIQVVMSDGRSKDEFTIELLDSNMILSYCSSERSGYSKLLDHFATGQSKWSSLVKGEENCLYHTLKSRQSIQYLNLKHVPAQRRADEESVVRAFDFAYSYCRRKAEMTTSDDFALGCTETLMKCFCTGQRLWHRSRKELQRVVEALHFKSNKNTSTLSDHQDSSSDPIYQACASTESALASLKNLSLVMQDKIKSLENVTEIFKSENDGVLAKLRASLLLKENERLRLHTLVSSDATGWLRTGISQRSGPRGSITCTLWRNWVVLRRSALLLFASPGQNEIGHMVFLDGATMQEVKGGSRKHDLKRAFALVERTGNIHIFIAGCDDEYLMWVNAISNAICPHSQGYIKAPSVEANDAPTDDSMKTERGQLSQSIVKVALAAKMKGQAAIARSIKQPVLVPDSDISSTGKGNAVPPMNNGVAPRMGQIRNRIAGVSQVTKGRLGSSLSAAKQKGKEAIQRRLLNAKKEAVDAYIADEVGFYSTDSPAETWECPNCYSLNILDLVQCKTCESIRSDSQKPEIVEDIGTTKLSALDQARDLYVDNLPDTKSDKTPRVGNEGEEHVDDRSDGSDFQDDNEFTSESSIKNRLSAVVRRAKIATSGRQMFGRQTTRQESQHDSVAGTGQGLKIGSIELNGPLRVSKYPFGECTNQIHESPLKKFEGTISVKVRYSERRENGESGRLQETDVKNATVRVVHDASEIPRTNSDEQTIPFTDQTLGSTNAIDDEQRPNSNDMNQFVDITFTINVNKFTLVGSTIERHEFTRNLSEIALLHATVSESVSQLPLQKLEDSLETEECGSVETPTAFLNRPSFIDNILISGRILGDLLDLQLRGGTQHQSISDYSAVYIEAFLNEIVNSPLPEDCLEHVKEFMQLSDDALNNATTWPRGVTDGEGSPLSRSLADGSNVISQFSAELDNACYQNRIAIRVLESIQPKFTAADESASLQAIQPNTLSIPPYQLSDGIYSVLNAMMLERDEAQSRLTLAEMLHQSERDELKMRIDDLTSQREAPKLRQDSQMEKNRSEEKPVNTGDTGRRDHESKAIYDSDIELQSLCQQLAGEISARTAAEISIVRMKESRKLEQELEASDRQALQKEVVRLQGMMQQMRARENEILQESRRWRESFEAVVQFQADNTSNATNPSTDFDGPKK